MSDVIRRNVLWALSGAGTALFAIAMPAAAQAPANSSDQTTQSIPWTFNLPRSSITSAGVFDSSGRLLRTLWRAEELPAGPGQRTWDGRDDRGQPVAAQDIEIRLVHHRLSYVWEGVIGNSSSAFGGPQLHKAFLPPTSIAIQDRKSVV